MTEAVPDCVAYLCIAACVFTYVFCLNKDEDIDE